MNCRSFYEHEKQAKEISKKYSKALELAKKDSKLSWCLESAVEAIGNYVKAVINDEYARKTRMLERQELGRIERENESRGIQVDPLDEARRAAHESLIAIVKALERCLQRDYEVSIFGLYPEEFAESNKVLHPNRRDEIATKAWLLWKGINGDYGE